jgi:hypothetical protein
MRILIAGIAGGLIMFMWSAFSHMVLQVGDAGLKSLPNEAAVISNLKANVPEPGMYFVPGMDMTKTYTAEEQAAWTERYTAGPNALLIYHPTGVSPMSASQLGGEFLSNVLAAVLVAFLFTWMVPSFAKRVAFAGLIGLISWLSISFSYWNWYRFPGEFISSELVDQVAGWLLAGLVMAFIVSRAGKTIETPASSGPVVDGPVV